MSKAVVALGSNVGESQQILQQAIADIGLLHNTTIVGVSSLYETNPVGGPEQNNFLNAVVLISTELSPHQLLSALHNIEAQHGRTREIHWGPRTLDLDLLDFENFTSSDETLLIPHPRAHERGFVLAPWADVAPDWLLPIPHRASKSTVIELLAELELEANDVRCIAGGTESWWRV